MRSLLLALAIGVTFSVAGSLACGSNPQPTSTTPATPGSAVILPSPATAETVPKSDPSAPAPSASAQ